MTTIGRTMISVAVAIAMAQPAAAQAPALANVLERAGAYVLDLEQKLQSIVAEERYVQDWRSLPKGWPLVADERHRELLSDLLLVKPPSADQWMQFRDVFEVDGAAVRDRSDRLMKLFVDAPPSTDRQIAGILDESARYNIGNISRTVNTPMVALTFLEPRRQSHYRLDPRLGMIVPADMRERYEGRRNGSRIEGRAVYGRFRQFQVNVDQTFLLKK